MLSMGAMFDPIAQQIHRCRDAQSLADCLLYQGLELSRARFGNVQLMNWKVGYLEIKAQSGFGDEFLNFFKRVYVGDVSACARALQKRSSIVIEDVTTDQQFVPCCEILTRAGVRAVQSTPMIPSSGAFMGVLSTHFPILHRPGEIEMRNLRHAAQVAADALVFIRVNGGSSSYAINASLEIVRDSQDALERTEKLLSRDPLHPRMLTMSALGH